MKRRKLLRGMAALAPFAVLPRLHAQNTPPPGTCRVISQDILGPFAIEKPPVRSDITGGLPGAPLELRLRIEDAFECRPLPGARVSIWHSNADGLYSAVENILLGSDNRPTGEVADHRGENWLRGMQTSDESGLVVFRTLVPGWYFPRTTHIHLQVFPPSFSEVATTQLYLPDETCDEAYAHEAYAARGPNPRRTDPNQDSPIDGTDEGDLWLKLERKGDGWVAEHRVGVTYYGTRFGELPEIYEQG